MPEAERSPLRILQVVSTLSLGGAERIVHRIAAELGRRGDAVSVAHLGSIAGNAVASELRADGFTPVDLGAAHLYDVGAVGRLVRLVKQGQFDVLHTHLLYADVHGRVAGRLAGVPVVSTLHNVLASFDGQRPDRRLLERLSARYLVDRIVTVTPSTASDLVRAWGVPQERAVFIPNGIDLEPWLRVPEPSGDGPVRVTTVGSLTRQKAQHAFIDAAASLLGRGHRVTFRIVGHGPLDAELRAKAHALGIENHIEFTGARADVPELMADSDIFVLSSAWEGMPLSAMEAGAAARPAVVTDVGAIRAVVEDGSTGLIVPPHDPGALADGIERLVGDADERRAMGRRAREVARSRFSHVTMVDRYREVYADVVRSVASKRRSPARSRRKGRSA